MYQTISLRFMVASSKMGRDGKASLMLSIIVNKKRVSIQLQKKLKPSEFNSKTQISTIKDVNDYISCLKSKIMGIQTTIFAQGTPISAQLIKDLYNGIQQNRNWCLIELYSNHNIELSKMIGITIGKNTHDKHEFLLNYLKKYMNYVDRPIVDLNTSFINGFYAFLRHDIKQQHNTAIGYMKKLRMIFSIYAYDSVQNIISIVSSNVTQGDIGGNMSHQYRYDNLYRLDSAWGSFVGPNSKLADYKLGLSYDHLHNITRKTQDIVQQNLKFTGILSAGYNLSYSYANNSQQIANIVV